MAFWSCPQYHVVFFMPICFDVWYWNKVWYDMSLFYSPCTYELICILPLKLYSSFDEDELEGDNYLIIRGIGQGITNTWYILCRLYLCIKIIQTEILHTYWSWLLQVPTEVNNRVQSLLLNYYLSALFRSGDFTLVYYKKRGELEYIRITEHYHDYWI